MKLWRKPNKAFAAEYKKRAAAEKFRCLSEKMNIYREELGGREFDWFAIDSEGNIGMFATGGHGKIPEQVIADYKSHDRVSEAVDSPNWGSENVWDDFAALGLYVFDWDLLDGPYIIQRVPQSSMPDHLLKKILEIPSLVKLNVNFSEIHEFNIQQTALADWR